MFDPPTLVLYRWLRLCSDHATALLRRAQRGDRGQSTAEYALVLLGAAAVALLLVAWATKTGKVTQLLNTVVDRVLAEVP